MLRLLLLTRLFPQCRLCGIKLQTVDKHGPGFYRLGEKKPTPAMAKYQAIENTLLESDRELLGIKPKTPHEKHEGTPQCVRCRDVLYRLEMVEPLAKLDFHEMINFVDPTAPVALVVNAQDFPLGVPPAVFAHLGPSLRIIVNKSDLLFATNNLATKYGGTFFGDYFHSKYGIPRDQVMVVLGRLGWNIKALEQWLPDRTHLIGHVNLGKLTLVGQLQLQHYQKQADDTPLSSSQRKQMEKLQDQGIKLARASAKKQLKQQLASVVGPGALYMPGLTRGVLEAELENKTIYDVPGFDLSEKNGVFGLLDVQNNNHLVFKAIAKGKNVADAGTYKLKYLLVTKPGQVVLLAGMVDIEFPGGIFQLRNVTLVEMTKFKDLEKVNAVRSNPDQYTGLGNKLVVGPHVGIAPPTMTRYILPPFHGPIDIVLRGLGHINITPTGKKETSDAIAVYLPDNIDAVVRQPIMNYIAKLFTGRDKNGNPLRKEHIYKKSTLALKRYANKTPFSGHVIASGDRQNDSEALLRVHSGDVSEDMYPYWVE